MIQRFLVIGKLVVEAEEFQGEGLGTNEVIFLLRPYGAPLSECKDQKPMLWGKRRWKAMVSVGEPGTVRVRMWVTARWATCLGISGDHGVWGRTKWNIKAPEGSVLNLRLFEQTSLRNAVYCMLTISWSQYSHYPWYWIVPILQIQRLRLKRLSDFDWHLSFSTKPSCFKLLPRPASFLSSFKKEVWWLSGN